MSKLAAFEAKLEELGGEDRFFDRLATTDDLEAIAREYGASLRTLNMWRNANDERRAAWDEAMQVSGHAYAAEGKAILDDLYTRSRLPNAVRLESPAVALAQARSVQRMKLAAARHPAAYGDRPQVVVNNSVNFQALHLSALQAKGSMALEKRPEVAGSIPAAVEAGLMPHVGTHSSVEERRPPIEGDYEVEEKAS